MFNHGVKPLTPQDNIDPSIGYRTKGLSRKDESMLDKVRLLINVLPHTLIEPNMELLTKKKVNRRGSMLFKKTKTPV